MKYDNLRAFEKHVEEAAPNHHSNVYLLIGKENFDVRSAAEILKRSLVGTRQEKEILCSFDAEKAALNDILAELNTLSFLNNRKVIEIRQLDKFNKEDLKKLESQLNTIPRSYFLILHAHTLSIASTFYKQAEKAGVVMDLPELKAWEKEKRHVDWVAKRVIQEKKQLTPQVAQFFVKQVGLDATLLSNELEKLLCYIGDKKEITLEDIKAIATCSNQESIWEFGEAIFSFNRKYALYIGKSLLSDETQFLSLLRQLRTQFQTEFQVCSLMTSGAGPDGIMAEFPYMKGRILERHIQSAIGYGMARFKKGLLAIDEIEMRSKNSEGDPSLLWELLIFKLTEK